MKIGRKIERRRMNTFSRRMKTFQWWRLLTNQPLLVSLETVAVVEAIFEAVFEAMVEAVAMVMVKVVVRQDDLTLVLSVSLISN